MSFASPLIDTVASVPERIPVLASALDSLNRGGGDVLASAAAALATPEGIVIAGYVLAVIVRLYGPGDGFLDRDIEAFGSDIDIDIDADLGIPILSDFTPMELGVIGLSLFYQYAVITPQTGLQALLMNMSYLILFGIFMDHIVNRYLVDQNE